MLPTINPRILPLTVSTQLVPRILDDSKDMTRRLFHPKTPEDITLLTYLNAGCEVERSMAELIRVSAPWRKGDILYIREQHYAFGHWQYVKGEFTKGGKQKSAFIPHALHGSPCHVFDVKELKGRKVEPNSYRFPAWYKRLARFMPKEYSRTFLEVLDVRLEKLGDISEADCISEGVEGSYDKGFKSYEIIFKGRYKGQPGPHAAIPNAAPLTSFMELWESINGFDSWDDRHWVWVIKFKRCEKPETFLKPFTYEIS